MLLASLAVLLAGCSATPAPPGPGTAPDPASPSPAAAPPPGALLIAGGGSFEDGAAYAAFLRHTPTGGDGVGHIVVLPTASSVPEQSGQGLANELRAIATRHTVSVVMLELAHPELADDPGVADAILSADGVWFTGGDQSRITTVFRPAGVSVAGMPGGPSAADTALRAVLAGGGMVGGTSAGAAMMSDPMIAGGRSEQALLAGVAGGGVQVDPGMGLFPYALTDQHFFERGRMGRLIAALEHTGGRWGLGIEEGAAVLVTLGDAPALTAIGTDAALLIDMAEATRDARGNRTGIRLSLLSRGDAWDPVTGTITPDPARVPRSALVRPDDPPATETPGDAWDADAVPHALHALAAHPDRPQTLRSRAFTLVFSADAQTRFAYRPDHRRDLCAVGVVLTIRRN
jgi:cyanophycinase